MSFQYSQLVGAVPVPVSPGFATRFFEPVRMIRRISFEFVGELSITEYFTHALAVCVVRTALSETPRYRFDSPYHSIPTEAYAPVDSAFVVLQRSQALAL